MSNTDVLLDYGTKLFTSQNLIEQRRIGSDFTIDVINDLVDLSKYRYDMCEKTNDAESRYYMGWHFDNAKIIEHKKGFDTSKHLNHTFMNDRYSIQYYLDRPEYSLIVYDSDYGDDFEGGVLEFIDGTKIYPKKGMYVFFNSLELHRVSRINKGTRKHKLIKFYIL